MDITSALTPPKTYMGGFTQPRQLNVFDPYDPMHKTKSPRPYVAPDETGYQPHCVYVLVSTHKIRFYPGRDDIWETHTDSLEWKNNGAPLREIVEVWNGIGCVAPGEENGRQMPRQAREYAYKAVWPGMEKSKVRRVQYQRERDGAAFEALGIEPDPFAEIEERDRLLREAGFEYPSYMQWALNTSPPGTILLGPLKPAAADPNSAQRSEKDGKTAEVVRDPSVEATGMAARFRSSRILNRSLLLMVSRF
jgi:hypothetical protein